jgi:ribosomal protein S18 acetylase RimI-like enzyme
MHKAEVRKWNDSYEADVIQLLRLNTPVFFAPEEEFDLQYYFKNHAENYYVILVDGIVIGAGGFNLSEDQCAATLSWDIIHPDWHGQRMGSLLTTYRIKKIRENPGITKLRVRTSQYTFGFYEKIGFKLLKIVHDYWASGFDLYDMEMDKF